MLCKDIGPLDASIMLIGEAPGAEEERSGIPFVGQSGKLLKAMCGSSGINFDKCYVTNICPDRPPNNKFEYFYEDSQRNVPKPTLAKRWEALGDKIKRIKPNVVICLGDEPLRAITNLRGIGTWRGTRIEAFGTKVISTYHPASILREYSHRVITEIDLRKAKRESEGLVYEKPEILINPTYTETIDWLRRCKETVSFDIETIGERVRCIGFAERRSGKLSALCIPFLRMLQSSPTILSALGNGKISCTNHDVNFWPKENECGILVAVASVLENPKIEKVGQNSVHFDEPFLEREFHISVENHSFDLMHAWHVLYPTFPKSLNFISSVYTDHPNYWTLHDSHIDQSEWTYNAMDCIATLDSVEKVRKDLRESKLLDFYNNRVHPLIFALLDTEKRGVLFDVEEAKKMKVRLIAKLKEIETLLSAFAGGPFNPNSPKQVKELLYEKLKYPKVYHHKTKKETANEDALRRLQKKYPSEPALTGIVNYRKTSKLISTYVEPKLDSDGRIRCSYNASGTITGRVSSSKTLRGTGMDLHNIPKGYTRGSESTRHLCRAKDGNVFVVGDLKQAEAMVVAWILKSL